MEYYPSATQEYGGIAIYMKFQNGTVTVTSEAGGVRLRIDMEVRIVSVEIDRGTVILIVRVETLGGLAGASRFGSYGNGKTYDISREVAAGYNSRYFSVVTENGTIPASFIYRVRRTGNCPSWSHPQNICRTSCSMRFPAGESARWCSKMDNFRSYELVLNGKTYDISREVAAGYNSRYFSVVTEIWVFLPRRTTLSAA